MLAKNQGQTEADDHALAFEKRKLNPAVALAMGARFRSGNFQFDYKDERGSLAYRKFRSGDKSQWWIEPKGVPLRMWGLDEIPLFEFPPTEPLIITEGEFDSVAFKQVLDTSAFCVSVPNGVAGKRTEGTIEIAEDHRFSYLWTEDCRLHPKIQQFGRVILATDDDEPGLILRHELKIRIGASRCWDVAYPKECKDGNDALIRYGERGIDEIFRRARPFRKGYLVAPSRLPKRRAEIAYSTGFSSQKGDPFLDKHLKLIRPELLVVTGSPGHGKGQFIRCLAFHMAESHGWKTAFLTPEDPPHRIMRDMRRFSLRNTPHPTQEQQDHAERWRNDHFMISMPPEDDPITIDFVISEMESAAWHHSCQIFNLDPWNEVSREHVKGETETQYIERTLVLLKQKARQLGLLLIIAAHPRKPERGEAVSLYSINGSANWRNKADHGLIVHRPTAEARTIQLVVEKSKDHETMGVPGTVHMIFDRGRCDYELGDPPEFKPRQKRGEEKHDREEDQPAEQPLPSIDGKRRAAEGFSLDNT